MKASFTYILFEKKRFIDRLTGASGFYFVWLSGNFLGGCAFTISDWFAQFCHYFFHIFVHSSSFLTPTYSFWGCIAVTISIFLSIHYWDNKLVLPSLSVCMSVCFSFIHLLLGRQHQSGSRFLRHTSEFEILLSMTHSKYNRLGIGHAEVLVPLKQF